MKTRILNITFVHKKTGRRLMQRTTDSNNVPVIGDGVCLKDIRYNVTARLWDYDKGGSSYDVVYVSLEKCTE